jgi:hypothetical protein
MCDSEVFDKNRRGKVLYATVKYWTETVEGAKYYVR